MKKFFERRVRSCVLLRVVQYGLLGVRKKAAYGVGGFFFAQCSANEAVGFPVGARLRAKISARSTSPRGSRLSNEQADFLLEPPFGSARFEGIRVELHCSPRLIDSGLSRWLERVFWVKRSWEFL